MSDVSEKLSSVEKFEKDEVHRAYREVMATHAGKRVLHDILSLCEIYGVAFTGENNATNYRLGMQEAGKRIIGQLDALDPRFYPKLLLDVADMKDIARATVSVATNQGTEDDDDAP